MSFYDNKSSFNIRKQYAFILSYSLNFCLPKYYCADRPWNSHTPSVVGLFLRDVKARFPLSKPNIAGVKLPVLTWNLMRNALKSQLGVLFLFRLFSVVVLKVAHPRKATLNKNKVQSFCFQPQFHLVSESKRSFLFTILIRMKSKYYTARFCLFQYR